MKKEKETKNDTKKMDAQKEQIDQVKKRKRNIHKKRGMRKERDRKTVYHVGYSTPKGKKGKKRNKEKKEEIRR